MKVYSERSGAILVLVLLMIALCGAITSQIAARVIRLGGQAADAQREAQHRWAAVSIRRTCLDLAPKLLTVPTAESNSLVATRSFSIFLSGNRYEVNVQDESAKLPVPRVIQRFPLESTKVALRSLAGHQAILRNVFPKNPTTMADIVSRPNLNDTSASLRYWNAVSERISLWSDGRINVVTADEATLSALWQLQFKANVPESLLELRHGVISNGIEELLVRSGASATQAKFANEWLTTSSNTHSVWIDSPSRTGKNFTAIYVRRRVPGFADEQFGFHLP